VIASSVRLVVSASSSMHAGLDSNSGKNMIGNSERDMRTSLW
jgi:hypothetical protein